MIEQKFHRAPIKSYRDLQAYQHVYQAAIVVMTKIVPFLPPAERFDLRDQLARSSKAVPRLIAEGFAKKHQRAGFQKYLDDAMAESNETHVGLCQVRDIYPDLILATVLTDFIDRYDHIGRQLYNLKLAWSKFSRHEQLERRGGKP